MLYKCCLKKHLVNFYYDRTFGKQLLSDLSINFCAFANRITSKALLLIFFLYFYIFVMWKNEIHMSHTYRIY